MEKKEQQYTIAIMLGETKSDYSEDLLRGFYSCAQELGVNLFFLMGPQMPQYCEHILYNSNAEGAEFQFATVYDYAGFVQPDALIIAYGSIQSFHSQDDQQEFLNRFRSIPVLLLENEAKESGLPYLMADNYSGMRACVEHLVREHGYWKIGFVSGPKDNQDSRERLNAYLDVMRENDLVVTEQMVVYGDFSEHVEEQIERLLNQNKDLEAIVFANDTMARTGYHVCEKRKLVVGRDIAITGFDDVEMARTLEPPLTSVAHSSFQFSYLALQKALQLCRGEKTESMRMPSVLHKRASCGCIPRSQRYMAERIELQRVRPFMDQQCEQIEEELLLAIPYESEKREYAAQLRGYFDYIYDIVFEKHGAGYAFDHMVPFLTKMCENHYVAGERLVDQLYRALCVLEASAPNDRAVHVLSQMMESTRKYINGIVISAVEQELMQFNRQAWFVPFFIRDLLTVDMDRRSTMLRVMERLKQIHIRNSYFFLFDQPIHYNGQGVISFTEKLRLVAWQTAEENCYYEMEQSPIVDEQHSIRSMLVQGSGHPYTAFVLFAEDTQYGLMVCEVEQKDIAFMQICSLQMGSMFQFMELTQTERKVQEELQNSLRLIREQNSILSFISSKDELTKLLNRRGFMEKAMHLIQENIGRTAYLLFGDLDHLKEINDCFGHAAGDFAIMKAADYLRECLPEDAVIGRIGGDEFVALFLSDVSDFNRILVQTLKMHYRQFNESSDKPYYVEMSVGIYEFYCKPQTDLADILKHSDAILYEEKAKRRPSVKK